MQRYKLFSNYKTFRKNFCEIFGEITKSATDRRTTRPHRPLFARVLRAIPRAGNTSGHGTGVASRNTASCQPDAGPGRNIRGGAGCGVRRDAPRGISGGRFRRWRSGGSRASNCASVVVGLPVLPVNLGEDIRFDWHPAGGREDVVPASGRAYPPVLIPYCDRFLHFSAGYSP